MIFFSRLIVKKIKVMSYLSNFKRSEKIVFPSLRTSITLMQSVQSYENGKYVSKGEFHESDMTETPYASMSIDDFSIQSVIAAGGNPKTVFVASSDVDSVMKNVDSFANSLNQVNDEKASK